MQSTYLGEALADKLLLELPFVVGKNLTDCFNLTLTKEISSLLNTEPLPLSNTEPFTSSYNMKGFVLDTNPLTINLYKPLPGCLSPEMPNNCKLILWTLNPKFIKY